MWVKQQVKVTSVFTTILTVCASSIFPLDFSLSNFSTAQAQSHAVCIIQQYKSKCGQPAYIKLVTSALVLISLLIRQTKWVRWTIIQHTTEGLEAYGLLTLHFSSSSYQTILPSCCTFRQRSVPFLLNFHIRHAGLQYENDYDKEDFCRSDILFNVVIQLQMEKCIQFYGVSISQRLMRIRHPSPAATELPVSQTAQSPRL